MDGVDQDATRRLAPAVAAAGLLIVLIACGNGRSSPSAASETAVTETAVTETAPAGTTGSSTSPGSTPPAAPQVIDLGSSAKADSTERQTTAGAGLVVWESNRSGAWRLWQRSFAGEPARQLTGDEPGRQHCCAHLAPAGDRLVYLSLPAGSENYPTQGASGELRLLNVADGSERVLADGARTYFEHRAAVWRDDAKVIYIAGDGTTRELEIGDDGGQRNERVLVETPLNEHGWLLDPSLSYATRGVPTFSPYDPKMRGVRPRANRGGCQPYFSQDGRWGIWIAGAGGPVRAIELATGAERTVLDKRDPRLADDAGYLYFPMLSDDSLWLAYGASADQHDHRRADYDIFLAPLDGDTLDIVGAIRQVSDHPATDRFPDVWAAPLALGRQSGEAPLSASFQSPNGDNRAWQWDFGDGARAESPSGSATSAEHLYEKPGLYVVTATNGQTVRRGEVRVRPASPPEVVHVEIDDTRLAVHFDEPVRVDRASAELASGSPLSDAGLAESDQVWRLRLDQPIFGSDELRLRGVVDRSAGANEADELSLRLTPASWPPRQDGLILLWHTGDRANLVPSAREQQGDASIFDARGLAFVDRDYAMTLRGGDFLADLGTAERLLAGARARNQLTVELTVTPDIVSSQAAGTLLSFAASNKISNFALSQRGDQLRFFLRTESAPTRGDPPGLDIGRLSAGKPHHVLISYGSGRTRAWIDGEPSAEAGPELWRSGFFHWQLSPLLTGRRWQGTDEWRGKIEGLAIYDQPFDDARAAEHARRYRAQLSARERLPKARIDATLVRRSPSPTLDEIAPYTQALAAFEYRVDKVVAGQLEATTVHVAHRVLLDGQELPIDRLRPGQSSRLLIESFFDQPQLESLVLSNDLGPPPAGGELWFSERLHP